MTAYGKRENAYFSVESGACREKVWNPPTVEEFLTAPDEGGYAAVAWRCIRAITDGENCRMVLSVPNNGAIDGLRDDDVVEMEWLALRPFQEFSELVLTSGSAAVIRGDKLVSHRVPIVQK